VLADDLMGRYGARQRQVCAVLKMSRSVYNYRSQTRDVKPVVSRIKEITATRMHLGKTAEQY
jgi:putative transposase